MFLVSEPRPLLLVQNTAVDSHETSLVEPQLPVARLTYFRCLVDEGSTFREHAVALFSEPLSPLPVRALVKRALSAARPTQVTFLSSSEASLEAVANDDRARTPGGPGLAAAAVCWATLRGELRDGESREAPLGEGLLVTRQGKFYSVARRTAE